MRQLKNISISIFGMLFLFYSFNAFALDGLVQGSYYKWKTIDLSPITDDTSDIPGQNWQRGFATDPSTPGRIYIWISRTLYVSNNSGLDWLPIYYESKQNFRGLQKLVVDSNGNIYLLEKLVNGYYVALYVSKDHGKTFSRIFPQNSEYIAATNIADIALGYNNSLYLLLNSDTRYESAIYKSTDEGNSWTQITDISTLSDFYHIRHLIVSKTSYGKILLVHGRHLLLSTNDGNSWQDILATDYFAIRDVQFDPNDDNTWYVVSDGYRFTDENSDPTDDFHMYYDIHITSDNGNSWIRKTLIPEDPTSEYGGGFEIRINLYRILKIDSKLYVIGHWWRHFRGSLTAARSGVWVSNDEGDTWTLKYVEGRGDKSEIYLYPIDFIFGHKEDNYPILYVLYDYNNHKLIRIDLNNNNEHYIGFDLGSSNSVSPNLWKASNYLVLSYGQGVIYTNSLFSPFKSIGISMNKFTHGTFIGTGHDTVASSFPIFFDNRKRCYLGFLGLSGELLSTLNLDTGNYTSIYSIDNSNTNKLWAVSNIVAKPNDPNAIYFNFGDAYSLHGLYYKDDFLDNPLPILLPHDPNMQDDNRFTFIFPDKPSVILEIQDQYHVDNGYRRYENSRIMRSGDNGRSWNVVLDSTNKFQDLEVSPLSPGTVYAIAGVQLYKSTDYGKNWDSLGVLPGGRPVSLALDNKNPNIMAIAVLDNYFTDVYITYNEGKNWEKLTTTSFKWGGNELLGAEHILSIISYSSSDRIIYLALAPNGYLHLHWYGIAEVEEPKTRKIQNTVNISWQNPKDPFFAGVRIYYSNDGENFTLMTDLNNGETRYAADYHPYFKLTCYDKEGNESRGKIVSSNNQPPVIDSFTATPKEGDAPLTVNFTCQAHDPDGGIIPSIEWYFGNLENPEVTFNGNFTIAHTYQNPGTYTAYCKVWDDEDDNITSDNITITIHSPETYHYQLDVNIFPEEGGTVTSDIGNINCPEGCTAEFSENTQVTLSAIAAEGYQFAGWTGDCEDCEDTNCSITMNSDKACNANFEPVAQPQWVNITELLNITHSHRALYDRRHKCFFVQITVENPGDTISGPIRFVITDPSIPVKIGVGVGLEPDGFTDDGDPYFIIVPDDESLGARQVLHRLRVNFELQRRRLTYGIKVEQLTTRQP